MPEVDQKEGMDLQGNQICKIYKFKLVTGIVSQSSTALLNFCIYLPKSEPGSNYKTLYLRGSGNSFFMAIFKFRPQEIYYYVSSVL